MKIELTPRGILMPSISGSSNPSRILDRHFDIE